MNHILTKLDELFPFLHQRSATEEDFHNYCDINGIEVFFSSEISTGVSILYEGNPYIFLNNKLRGFRLLNVMFHELAHCIFHFPSQARFGTEFFSTHFREKNHIEADAVSALLLLPTYELHNALQNIEFASEDLEDLIGTRLELYGKYNV